MASKSALAPRISEVQPPEFLAEVVIQESKRRDRAYYAAKDALNGPIKKAILDAPIGRDVIITIAIR